MIQTCLSSADRNMQQLFVSVSLLNICPGTRMSPPACTGGRRETFPSNHGTPTSTSVLCCLQVEVVPSWSERTCRRTRKARCNSDPAAPEKPPPSGVTQKCQGCTSLAPAADHTTLLCVCTCVSLLEKQPRYSHSTLLPFPYFCIFSLCTSTGDPFIAANNKNGDLPSPEVTVHSTSGVSAVLGMLHTCGKLVSNKSLFLSIFSPL